MKKRCQTLLLISLICCGICRCDSIESSMARSGKWVSQCYRFRNGGIDALMVWAAARKAVAQGHHAQPAWLTTAIDSLATMEPKTTLAASLRICAFGEISMFAWKRQIKRDADWLVRYQSSSGGWSDSPGNKRTNILDTAWAIYALNVAHGGGVKIPDKTWKRAKAFLTAVQNSDGGFGFEGPDVKDYRLKSASYGLTTAAAVVAMEIIDSRLSVKDDPALMKAAAWLENRSSPLKISGWRWGRRNRPMAEYRFWLAMAIDDGTGVCDAINEISSGGLKNPTGDLAEDKTVADGFTELTLAFYGRVEKTNTPSSTASKTQDTLAMPLRTLHVDIIADDKPAFIDRVAGWLANEMLCSYSQRIESRNIGTADKISQDCGLVWWALSLPPERSAMRDLAWFMKNGGIVLFDPSTEQGYVAVEKALQKTFGVDSLERASIDSPIITGKFAGGVGSDVSDAIVNAALRKPAITLVRGSNGEVVAVLSALPLSRAAANHGSAADTISPESSIRLLLNIILFSQAQKANAVTPGG